MRFQKPFADGRFTTEFFSGTIAEEMQNGTFNIARDTFIISSVPHSHMLIPDLWYGLITKGNCEKGGKTKGKSKASKNPGFLTRARTIHHRRLRPPKPRKQQQSHSPMAWFSMIHVIALFSVEHANGRLLSPQEQPSAGARNVATLTPRHAPAWGAVCSLPKAPSFVQHAEDPNRPSSPHLCLKRQQLELRPSPKLPPRAQAHLLMSGRKHSGRWLIPRRLF